MTRRLDVALVDAAAGALSAHGCAFSAKNLFHAARRLAEADRTSFRLGFEAFRAGPLAERLRAGPLPGLLPEPTQRQRGARLSREWDAYFPACILLVDRAELIPLFAASGVIVQARMAVVALDGAPAPVTSWLCRGLAAGHRAPIGYLHDASTVVYQFSCRLLATWVRVRKKDETDYRDLGLPPLGLPAASVGLSGPPVREVEEPPSHAVIAYAARALLAMIPPDPMLFPRAPRRRSARLEVTHDRSR